MIVLLVTGFLLDICGAFLLIVSLLTAVKDNNTIYTEFANIIANKNDKEKALRVALDKITKLNKKIQTNARYGFVFLTVGFIFLLIVNISIYNY